MHGTIDRQKPYWAACQVFSSEGHKVRAEIEKSDRGAFLPTFVRVKYIGGKKYVQELPLLSGYLFFMTEPSKWGDVPEIEGVLRVLASGNIASRVTDEEMYRLTLDHALGMHNQIQSGYQPHKRNSRRRRRPRPGKALRGKQ